MTDFASALSDVCSAWPALVPPNRMPVSHGAAKHLKIARPGGASGAWSPDETPYLVEPMDMLASRRHQAVCFVGPSQSGKTVAFGEGWLSHIVMNDPGDMLIVQMTQEKSREYSRQRIDRMFRNSPTLKSMQGSSSRDDNLHDKVYRNGMMLRLAWPTASNLSSTSYRTVFMTDYDRWPDDIDGEGDGFGLGLARIRTFLSRGKLAVESSPGRELRDPAWRPSTPHEAPPVKGILGIYNRSDRRRYYWPCPHCGEWFEAKPGLANFSLPPEAELIESIRSLDIDAFARQFSVVGCPASGCVVSFDARQRMNRDGRWLQDGLVLDAHGRLSGNPRESSIAGYWLGGVAASYITWETLLRKYAQALLDFALTGSELSMQTTVNTDQCAPYMSRHVAEAAATQGNSLERSEPDLPRYVVPETARYLAAAVDVQGGARARFVVQVHAVGENQEETLIDRYSIKMSKREGIGDDFAPIDPASHGEDWDLLTEKVVLATYRTHQTGRELRVKLTAVDTGGEDGVTDKSYAWYRRIRKEGLANRVMMIKGVSVKNIPWYIRETWVGSKQGQGDIPLHLLNTDRIKDLVDACLRRRTAGPGYYHFPKPKDEKLNPNGWLAASFFDELKAEVRNENGVWEKLRPNEAFDACVYIKAVGMKLGVDRVNFWLSPPRWAMPLDQNSEVVTSEERRETKQANAAPLPTRRSSHSAYMG